MNRSDRKDVYSIGTLCYYEVRIRTCTCTKLAIVHVHVYSWPMGANCERGAIPCGCARFA
jgi:hypothetical protein